MQVFVRQPRTRARTTVKTLPVSPRLLGAFPGTPEFVKPSGIAPTTFVGIMRFADRDRWYRGIDEQLDAPN